MTKELEPQDRAPDFELKAQDGQLYRLSDFRGQPVVLAFYPMDFSGVCTEELACFVDSAVVLGKLDAQVLGVSVDSHHCHRAFAEALGIQYLLLADFHPKGAVGQLYGAYLPDHGYHARWTFVIDPEGRIAYIQKNIFGEVPDMDEILEALREIV